MIKFRAWHKEFKKMYDVCEMHFKDELDMLVLRLDKGSEPCEIEEVWPEEIGLMQWTYNVDKNKKDIYAWDIIKLGDEDLYYVSTFRGTYILSWRQGNYVHNGKLLADFRPSEMEVVGNIWENSDKLNETT